MWAVGKNSRLTIGGQGYQFFANNPQGTYNHPNDADTELVGAVIKGGIQTTGWYAGPNDTSGAAKGPQLQAFFIVQNIQFLHDRLICDKYLIIRIGKKEYKLIEII